jgi:hypothetical protein
MAPGRSLQKDLHHLGAEKSWERYSAVKQNGPEGFEGEGQVSLRLGSDLL